MQDFRNICKIYNEIKLNLYKGDKKITLRDILPENVCPLAFHSVYPYMVTLLNGGWLNWVGHNEHVIVNCPSPRGVAMYVKAPSKDSPNLIELEVMQASPFCFKQYELKDTFVFDFSGENQFNFKVLDNITPFISNTGKSDNKANEFLCGIDGKEIRCQAYL